MADSKLTALTGDASPTAAAIIYVVIDPGGTPEDRKVTLADLATALAAMAGAITDAGGPVTIAHNWSGSQAQYDALGSYDADTLYFTPEAQVPVYRGSTVIHSGSPIVNPVPFGQLLAETASAVTANLAYFVPVKVHNEAAINLLGVRILTSAGLIDLGLYDHSVTAPGDLLVSTGIVTTPAAGNQELAVSEVVIPAGVYWLAIRASTGSFVPWEISAVSASGGLVDPDAGSLLRPHTLALGSSVPLPASAAGAAAAVTKAPVLWANAS